MIGGGRDNGKLRTTDETPQRTKKSDHRISRNREITYPLTSSTKREGGSKKKGKRREGNGDHLQGSATISKKISEVWAGRRKGGGGNRILPTQMEGMSPK